MNKPYRLFVFLKKSIMIIMLRIINKKNQMNKFTNLSRFVQKKKNKIKNLKK